MNQSSANEPAFPCGRDVTLDQFAPSTGITVRDYFAAKVINVVCQMSHFELQVYTGNYEESKTLRLAGIAAYMTADAMLEARS